MACISKRRQKLLAQFILGMVPKNGRREGNYLYLPDMVLYQPTIWKPEDWYSENTPPYALPRSVATTLPIAARMGNVLFTGSHAYLSDSVKALNHRIHLPPLTEEMKSASWAVRHHREMIMEHGVLLEEISVTRGMEASSVASLRTKLTKVRFFLSVPDAVIRLALSRHLPDKYPALARQDPATYFNEQVMSFLPYQVEEILRKTKCKSVSDRRKDINIVTLTQMKEGLIALGGVFGIKPSVMESMLPVKFNVPEAMKRLGK